MRKGDVTKILVERLAWNQAEGFLCLFTLMPSFFNLNIMAQAENLIWSSQQFFH